MNEGINWNCEDNIYWKHSVERYEACEIILHGNAEFEAKDITIQARRHVSLKRLVSLLVDRSLSYELVMNIYIKELAFLTMQGNHIFEVPDGYKLKITSGSSGIFLQYKLIYM